MKRVDVCHIEAHIWPLRLGREELMNSFHLEPILVNLSGYNLCTIKWIN